MKPLSGEQRFGYVWAFIMGCALGIAIGVGGASLLREDPAPADPAGYAAPR